jgi:pilus assembly protein CpaF
MAYDELLGIGPLGPLWRDVDVTDILVDGPNSVTVERRGNLIDTPVRFRNLAHLQATARRLSTKIDDRGVSRSNPIVTVQLPGARVLLVWDPVAVSGCSVSIRKHREQLTLPQLLQAGALNEEMVAFLSDVVKSRATVLVSGATGTGKTTYLNVLSGFIPNRERVIVIEDARELKLSNSRVEYLLTKEKASADDTVVIGFDQLLRAALRMRPDRILVGEILDAAGARAMLEAAFTGHDGTMSTLHANDPEDALLRVADLLRESTGMPDELAQRRVNATFDAIVHVIRDQSGVRYVSHIAAVRPDGTTDLLYHGHVELGGGKPIFVREKALRADTPLARRLAEAGIDTNTWQ